MYKIMALAAIAVLVLSGCAGRGPWVGEWRGDREMASPPGSDPAVAATLAAVKLKISSEGRFELTEEGFGKAGPALLGADTATLIIDTMLDRPIASLGQEAVKLGGERKLALQKDGTVLFQRYGFEPVVLKSVED